MPKKILTFPHGKCFEPNLPRSIVRTDFSFPPSLRPYSLDYYLTRHVFSNISNKFLSFQISRGRTEFTTFDRSNRFFFSSLSSAISSRLLLKKSYFLEYVEQIFKFLRIFFLAEDAPNRIYHTLDRSNRFLDRRAWRHTQVNPVLV